MSTFRFYQPIQVRYGDLDAQGHVNNARLVTFLEQARYGYVTHLGLFSGNSFLDFPLILADLHVSYLQPVYITQEVQVGLRTAHIGNKSLKFVYQVEDSASRTSLARAETVMVAYDYHAGASMRVPDEWRDAISRFEAGESSQP